MSPHTTSWLISVAAAALLPAIALAATPTVTRAPLKDVMVKIVEPASNAVFYISRQTPKNDDEWKTL